MSRHHILPQHFWHGIGGICYLCRDCHDEIERRITRTERIYSGSKTKRFQLAPYEYREILRDFLTERSFGCGASLQC